MRRAPPASAASRRCVLVACWRCSGVREPRRAADRRLACVPRRRAARARGRSSTRYEAEHAGVRVDDARRSVRGLCVEARGRDPARQRAGCVHRARTSASASYLRRSARRCRPATRSPTRTSARYERDRGRGDHCARARATRVPLASKCAGALREHDARCRSRRRRSRSSRALKGVARGRAFAARLRGAERVLPRAVLARVRRPLFDDARTLRDGRSDAAERVARRSCASSSPRGVVPRGAERRRSSSSSSRRAGRGGHQRPVARAAISATAASATAWCRCRPSRGRRTDAPVPHGRRRVPDAARREAPRRARVRAVARRSRGGRVRAREVGKQVVATRAYWERGRAIASDALACARSARPRRRAVADADRRRAMRSRGSRPKQAIRKVLRGDASPRAALAEAKRRYDDVMRPPPPPAVAGAARRCSGARAARGRVLRWCVARAQPGFRARAAGVAAGVHVRRRTRCSRSSCSWCLPLVVGARHVVLRRHARRRCSSSASRTTSRSSRRAAAPLARRTARSTSRSLVTVAVDGGQRRAPRRASGSSLGAAARAPAAAAARGLPRAPDRAVGGAVVRHGARLEGHVPPPVRRDQRASSSRSASSRSRGSRSSRPRSPPTSRPTCGSASRS